MDILIDILANIAKVVTATKNIEGNYAFQACGTALSSTYCRCFGDSFSFLAFSICTGYATFRNTITDPDDNGHAVGDARANSKRYRNHHRYRDPDPTRYCYPYSDSIRYVHVGTTAFGYGNPN